MSLQVILIHIKIWDYVSDRLGIRTQVYLIPKPMPLEQFGGYILLERNDQ